MNRPNILLIILDATRKDACSCYGNPHSTTPSLDVLANEGVLFENAFSVAPWTLPSLASIFTGCYPSQNSIYINRRLEPSHKQLHELLSTYGYSTFAISDNPWMSADFGLSRGFSQVHRLWQWWQTNNDINNITLAELKTINVLKAALQMAFQGNVLKNILNVGFYRLIRPRLDYGASRTLRPLSHWIDSQNGPWFAVVHYLEAHMNYTPPHVWRDKFVSNKALASRLMRMDQWRLARRHIAGVELVPETELKALYELYIAEVAYADYHMGRLIDWLRDTNRLDDTLVIAVADHGENLGEHGLLEHQYCIYDTLLRVPLVIRFPRLFPKAQRVEHPVQTIDLASTILDVADIQAMPSAGHSLLPSSPYPPVLAFAEYGVPRSPHPRWLKRFGLRQEDLSKYQRGFTSVRDDTHKLIVGTDQSVELYNWRQDPNEECNLAGEKPDVVECLVRTLEDWWVENGSGLGGDPSLTSVVNPQVEERLRALGYLD